MSALVSEKWFKLIGQNDVNIKTTIIYSDSSSADTTDRCHRGRLDDGNRGYWSVDAVSGLLYQGAVELDERVMVAGRMMHLWIIISRAGEYSILYLISWGASPCARPGLHHGPVG